MNKIATVDSKIRWKVTKTSNGYIGECSRLNLSATAASMEELVDEATEMMYNLFKEQYDTDKLNEYAFNHSLTYRVKDYEGFIDLSVPVILGDR